MNLSKNHIRKLFNTAVISGAVFFASNAAHAQTSNPVPPPDVDTWEVVSDTNSIPDQGPRPAETPEMATPTIFGGTGASGTQNSRASTLEIIQDGLQLGEQIITEKQQQKSGAQEIDIQSHRQGIDLGTKILVNILSGGFGQKR